MFTGIVTAIGEVVEAERKGPNLKRLAIACPYEAEGIAIGASIACAGVCLTVTALRPRTDGEPGCIFQVEAAAETLAKTLVGEWEPGTRVNLERSLKVGDELGGHLVVGHVDGPGRILKIDAIEPDPDEPWGRPPAFTSVPRKGWRASSRPRARSASTAPRSPSTRSRTTSSPCC